MAVARSSADPAKLAGFATATLEALRILKARADDVTRTVEALGSAGVDLPRLDDTAADLADLVGDWEHLGFFARDVANGFYAFLGEVGYQGGVVTLGDRRLAELGTIGFADRDAAIAAAEAMADRYRALLDGGYEGLAVEAVWDVLHLADRGRYDPAFAVAFSEAVGVEGYVDLVAMLRTATTRPAIHDPVPPEGLEGVEVLATLLTTALGTLPGLPPGEGSPATAGWSDGERLDPRFLDDLAHGFDPEEGRYNTDFPVRTNTDLAVLVGLTAPPTSAAVRIADGRLTPLLRDPERFDARPGDEGADWGDHGGRVTNYARMLARDPDASAQWLVDEVGGTRNIDLVLRRESERLGLDVDGGRTLAEVVEHGVTHTDDDLRRTAMHQAIEVIGGRQDEIRNPHLPDVLARGVAHNMDLVDDLVNIGWAPHTGQPPTGGGELTHDFLVEVFRDESAATTVHRAIQDHSLERLRALPPEDPSMEYDFRTMGLREIGHLHGMALSAEAHVVQDSIEEYAARREQAADSLNVAVGLIPWADGAFGIGNDIADVYNFSLGELIAGRLVREPEGLDQDVASLRNVLERDGDVNTTLLLAAARDPVRFSGPVSELSGPERAELLSWAYYEVYNGSDHDSLIASMARALFDFAPWVRQE